ncbi:hypothetical protein [Yeosuana marina]
MKFNISSIYVLVKNTGYNEEGVRWAGSKWTQLVLRRTESSCY